MIIPREDIDRQTRKQGGRGFASTEDRIYASIQCLED